MSNQEAIAAILAANTPLKAARYAVDNPPAQEIGSLLDQVVELTDKVTELTRVAGLAYDAIDHELDGYDVQPPAILLHAHAQLYGLLKHTPEVDQQGDDLPF
jgi:hypothetical protein